MQTIRITKEFGFEMAHALQGHDGPCRHIHGHSYVLSVTLIGTPSTDKTSPKLGMVMDFSELKKIVKEHIIDQFDHALVLRDEQLPRDMADQGHYFSKMVRVAYQPTSENLLIDFAQRLKPMIPAGMKLYSLRLRETATAYAEWFSADNA